MVICFSSFCSVCVLVLLWIFVVGFIGMLMIMWVELVVIFLDSIEVISWLVLFMFSVCFMWISMLLVGVRFIVLFYMM